jgi:transglutaminase-like putative cysteine protease
MVSILLVTTLVLPLGEAPLDPNAPYTAVRSNPLRVDVGFDVVFTPPYKAAEVGVWIPVPPDGPGQEVSDYSIEPAGAISPDPLFGNRLAHIAYSKPVGAQVIRQRYVATSYELAWNVDPGRVTRPSSWPESFDRYLRSEASIVVDGEIRALAREIVSVEQNPALQARAVMTWIIDHLEYDHTRCSLRASSKFAIENRCGHCSDYHGLTTALLRALGVPARVTYGINLFQKNSPSHCKIELFLPPYGWVSFDVSETQKLLRSIEGDAKLPAVEKDRLRAKALERLFSGYRDNTWLLLTRGTDYPLVPASKTPAPLVRTAYIEADGVPLKDPDPGNKNEREFAWMTVTRFDADRKPPYPFDLAGFLSLP